MKKKFFSLLLVFCLALPIGLGLVGCGDSSKDNNPTDQSTSQNTKTDAEILSTAYGQVATSITSKAQSSAPTTTSARIAVDTTGTDSVFTDITNFDESAQISVCLVSFMKQIYSNETIVNFIKNLKTPLKFTCSYASTGKYQNVTLLKIKGLSIYSTIDKDNGKIKGYCLTDCDESNNARFFVIDIDYNFTTNEVTSFKAYVGTSSSTPSELYVLRNANSKLEVAVIDSSKTSAEAETLKTEFGGYYTSFTRLTAAPVPGDYSSMYTTAVDSILDSLTTAPSTKE